MNGVQSKDECTSTMKRHKSNTTTLIKLTITLIHSTQAHRSHMHGNVAMFDINIHISLSLAAEQPP